jgi:DNA recombination protein RmuC
MPLIFTAFLAAGLSALIVWFYWRGRAATLTERTRALAEENNRLGQEITAQRAEAQRLLTLVTQHATELTAEKSAHERLVAEFKSLSADALRSNRDDFLAQAQQSFAQLQTQSAGDLEKRQFAIDALVKPLRESLEKVDGKIAEIEKARASAYGALGEQLKTLGTAQLQLQAEANKLSTALRSTSFAGSWGELQLRRVVEMADMLPYCDFSEQETAEAGGFRADLVVRLPGGQRIVVDAKAPLESYRAAVDAVDADAVQRPLLPRATGDPHALARRRQGA